MFIFVSRIQFFVKSSRESSLARVDEGAGGEVEAETLFAGKIRDETKNNLK